jgi:hypothetical protein
MNYFLSAHEIAALFRVQNAPEQIATSDSNAVLCSAPAWSD